MTPEYRILCDGLDITARLEGRLTQMTITDEAGEKADRIDLTLDDRGEALPLPAPRAEFRVWFGYAGQPLAYAGRYTFDEVEYSTPPSVMLVRAKAADLTRGLRRPRSRSWHDTTLGDIAAEIAAERGLAPRLAPALAGIRIDHVDQTEESDIAFLSRLAAENGGVARPADGALLLLERGQQETPGGTALPPLVITRGMVTRARVALSERGNYAAVTAWHEDHAGGRRTAVTAGDAAAEGESYQLRTTHRTAAEAERAARARLAELQRGRANLSVEMPGLPALQAERTVRLDGFRDPIAGLWRAKTVTHTLSRRGLVTRFEAEIGGSVPGDTASDGALPGDEDDALPGE